MNCMLAPPILVESVSRSELPLLFAAEAVWVADGKSYLKARDLPSLLQLGSCQGDLITAKSRKS